MIQKKRQVLIQVIAISEGFPGGASGENPPTNAENIRDAGSIPGSGRCPGGGRSNPLHILAWRIPWTEKPGGLQSIGLQRVGHD